MLVFSEQLDLLVDLGEELRGVGKGHQRTDCLNRDLPHLLVLVKGVFGELLEQWLAANAQEFRQLQSHLLSEERHFYDYFGVLVREEIRNGNCKGSYFLGKGLMVVQNHLAEEKDYFQPDFLLFFSEGNFSHSRNGRPKNQVLALGREENPLLGVLEHDFEDCETEFSYGFGRVSQN